MITQTANEGLPLTAHFSICVWKKNSWHQKSYSQVREAGIQGRIAGSVTEIVGACRTGGKVVMVGQNL